MNMFEELKAWAEKWNVTHTITENSKCIEIMFDSATYSNPMLSYNKETGNYTWYGGE